VRCGVVWCGAVRCTGARQPCGAGERAGLRLQEGNRDEAYLYGLEQLRRLLQLTLSSYSSAAADDEPTVNTVGASADS
jgi:hypothetical protein